MGSGTLKPTLTLTSRYTWLSEGKIFVQVKYRNEEDASTHGSVTASVKAESTTYTGTSSETTFPPHEETEVNFTIEGLSQTDYNRLVAQGIFQTQISLSGIADIVCPHCDGTGLGSVRLECPTCGGTGIVHCPTCSGSVVDGGGQNGNLNIPLDMGSVALGVVVVAGVAIAAFVVVKKRKVSEKDLGKLPSSEFQNRVLKN